MILQLACTVVASVCFADDQPKVMDILEKVDNALAPPVRYRIRLKGVEASVSRKYLSDGILASRTEAVAPSQTVSIAHGENNYEVLSQSRVVIDKTRILTKNLPAGFLQCNELSLCFIPDIPKDTEISEQHLTTVTRGGGEYYRIETQYSLSHPEAPLRHPGPLLSGIRARQILIVDKTTYVPVEIDYLSPTGSSLSSYEFIEIVRSPELLDELFELPSDYVVKTPTSINEYFDLHRELWNDIQPAPTWRPFFPTIYEREESKYAKMLDPQTSSVDLTGMTVEQMEARIEALQKETHQNLSRPSDTGIGAIIILGNIVALLATTLFYLVRLHRREKPT